MAWNQAIIVYGVCWWLLLFMALPVGIRQTDEGGAPSSPKLGIKCLAVTILAALVTWAIDIFLHSGIVTVH